MYKRQIADYMNLGGKNDDEKVALLIAYLRKMNDQLNIPHGIKNYGADSYPCEQGLSLIHILPSRALEKAIPARHCALCILSLFAISPL